MAQKNRDKEYWLIPKRANLHQSVVLLKGIIESNYNGKTWNPSKQDRLGSYLGKQGATKSGKNITPQALRTLLASIPQYFGFSFINTNTTPNTLFVTQAGFEIVKESMSILDQYDYDNLAEAEKNNGTINYSETYLKQFLKLQLSNPVILKDCESVLVFPLIFTLQVLKTTRYLTYEELALFIFRSKSQSEVELVILEIQNFRNLKHSQQQLLITALKKTHLGNISLVQAPTTSYYQKLCSYTGLIKKSNIIDKSGVNKKINTIEINTDQENKIDRLLEKYNFVPYDFKNNLSLWLQYIGNTNIISPPKDITVINCTTDSQLIIISENNKIIAGDLIISNDIIKFPAIENHDYQIKIYNKSDGSTIKSIKYQYSEDDIIRLTLASNVKINPLNLINDIPKNILDHINAKNFSEDYTKYLSIISKLTSKNLVTSKNLRGSRLEFLFFKYFSSLENKNIIDEVIWNGRIGQYGIPSPSPGGPKGQPDLLLFVSDSVVVVELTTIKSKSQQWSAEGASVPDHIRLIEEYYPNKKIFAIYLAPIIHEERITKGMLSRLENYESKLHCLCIEDFLNLSLGFETKNDFISFLKQ